MNRIIRVLLLAAAIGGSWAPIARSDDTIYLGKIVVEEGMSVDTNGLYEALEKEGIILQEAGAICMLNLSVRRMTEFEADSLIAEMSERDSIASEVKDNMFCSVVYQRYKRKDPGPGPQYLLLVQLLNYDATLSGSELALILREALAPHRPVFKKHREGFKKKIIPTDTRKT